MKAYGLTTMMGIALLALTTMSGCDREISRETSVDVKDDGTVKTSDKTVTRNPDGSTTVTEEKSTTKP